MHSTRFPALESVISEGQTAFHVINLGCKVNRVESDTIAASLLAKGCKATALDEARLVVVNTCTVTGEADKKARKAVRHALATAKNAVVVVTGCSVAIDADTYRNLDSRVEVIQRADLLMALAQDEASSHVRMGEGFRTRVSLKVQDGCDHACTYCIVHVARGPATSVPAEKVMADARRYLERGVKELVLTGIDLGSYRDGDMRVEHLVEGLLELADTCAGAGEQPARVRASSLEPHSISDRFIELLATSDGRLCRHVHLPLQSGSTRVLHEMARTYSAESFTELIAELRSRVPSLSLTTDIICGFPGETEEDFARTLEIARACAFSKIHVFPYSRREGTPAAARADQIDALVKTERTSKLRSLAEELREADLRSRSGNVELALVEGDVALTESYHEIPAPAGARLGQLVAIEVNSHTVPAYPPSSAAGR